MRCYRWHRHTACRLAGVYVLHVPRAGVPMTQRRFVPVAAYAYLPATCALATTLSLSVRGRLAYARRRGAPLFVCSRLPAMPALLTSHLCHSLLAFTFATHLFFFYCSSFRPSSSARLPSRSACPYRRTPPRSLLPSLCLLVCFSYTAYYAPVHTLSPYFVPVPFLAALRRAHHIHFAAGTYATVPTCFPAPAAPLPYSHYLPATPCLPRACSLATCLSYHLALPVPAPDSLIYYLLACSFARSTARSHLHTPLHTAAPHVPFDATSLTTGATTFCVRSWVGMRCDAYLATMLRHYPTLYRRSCRTYGW